MGSLAFLPPPLRPGRVRLGRGGLLALALLLSLFCACQTRPSPPPPSYAPLPPPHAYQPPPASPYQQPYQSPPAPAYQPPARPAYQAPPVQANASGPASAKDKSDQYHFSRNLAKARAGDGQAMTAVGLAYQSGEGVAKDDVQAFAWFSKAAAQGDPLGIYHLGQAHLGGLGTRQDIDAGLRYISQAAHKGLPQAVMEIFFLSTLTAKTPEDSKKARAWLIKAIKINEPSALTLAGFVLAWKPPSQRQKEAGLGLLLKAAQNDYAESQFLLGFNNLFDKKDSSSSKAVGWSWVLKAANANNVLAQSLVGNIYYRGMPEISVQRDPEQAYKWLLLAQGGPNWADMFDVIIRDAKRNMARLEQELPPQQKASAMAMVKAFRDAHGDKRPPSVFEKLARVEKARPGAIEALVADEPGKQSRESAQAAPGKEGKARDKEASSPQKSYGTGFVVSAQGHVLTNHHVIEGAKEVKTLGIDQPLLVLAKDPANDLALLKLPRPTARPLVFARNLARAGEEAVVMGYPLYGLLGSDPRVTTGTVSALSGIENDTRFMQISAPVQPGNSGGPVLDPSGHVIGVMVAKLDAIKVAEAIGDIPQNVNFALKGELAQAFLRVQGVRFEAAPPGAESKPADIAERARESVLLLVVE